MDDNDRECRVCGADILGNDPHGEGCPVDEADRLREFVQQVANLSLKAYERGGKDVTILDNLIFDARVLLED